MRFIAFVCIALAAGCASAPGEPVSAPGEPAVAVRPPAPPLRKPASPPAAKAAVPALDVAALKARLKDTQGIGILTKLALKNQMDDLLDKMRSSHALKASVATLRPAYDNLIVKALSVLHDGDPGLAATIARSREVIWDLLADPVKFHEAS